MRTKLIYVLICSAAWTTALSAPIASSAQAAVVKITSINDSYGPTHADSIDVQPGDLVTFSADILDDDNGMKSMGAPVEDFVWSADDSDSDVCNVASSSDCLSQSNFQATDYGVSFYVPYTIGQQIVINVSSPNSDSTDSIILNNAAYQDGASSAPTQVVTDPSQYNYDTLDPVNALAGQGRWITVSNQRFWAPYTYVANNDSDWAPYRNGYWAFDAQRGHTWVSFDPWGWMTDHYGIWRQHSVYGWVWMPFDDLHYEPHTVSWFDDQQAGYVGWYPYFPSFARGYAISDGFIDGYWNNFECARGFGEANYGWRPGYTIVRYGDFQNANIEGVYERNIYGNEIVIGVIGRAFDGNRFARFPGMADNFNDGRAYLEARGSVVSEVRIENLGRNGMILAPQGFRPVPQIYQQIGRSDGLNRRPAPIGSVIDTRNPVPGQPPRMIPPTSNGRGIVNPPRIDDGQGNRQPMPPRTGNPAQRNPENPVGPRPQPQPAPRPQPQPQPAPRPQPQPQPAPRPQPQPQPAPRPQPQPQPAPRPQPQPQPAPRPQPQPQPAPRPQPQPQPAPRPQPQPQPAPRPAPAPQPTPRPAPAPQPAPRPAPAPQPAPRPAPAPQPAPRPAPAPQPAPRPAPAPAPRPAPGPHPK